MEQVSIADDASPIGNDIDGYYFDLSEIITEIERRVNEQTWLNLKKPFKLYPESAVEYWKRRTEIAEQNNALNEKLLDKKHNKLLDAQDYIKKVCAESSADIQRLDAENKKLKHELSKCRASNAFYLDDKQKAVKRAELLEKEVADLKVPESRQNRHLRDELHRSRLECQQAWESANKEMAKNKELSNHIFVLDGKLEKLELDNHSLDQVASVFQSDLAKKDAEIKELRERNDALKRQLDESNKQIEIHAKKVRNLEAELEVKQNMEDRIK